MKSSPTSSTADRKSTRLNSSHTEIYTLSLHDALPIFVPETDVRALERDLRLIVEVCEQLGDNEVVPHLLDGRSEEHTSELQSHRDLHSFPTRRSSDLCARDGRARPGA